MPYLSKFKKMICSHDDHLVFVCFSSHFFADMISPMLIAAQTALLGQLRERQGTTDQAHFQPAITALGRPIHPDDFFTLRPEKLYHIRRRIDEDLSRVHSASTLSLGARLDPRGTDFYARKLTVSLSAHRTLLNNFIHRVYTFIF